jgi:hypothetical protein
MNTKKILKNIRFRGKSITEDIFKFSGEVTLCIIVELKKVSSNTVFMYNKTAYGV